MLYDAGLAMQNAEKKKEKLEIKDDSFIKSHKRNLIKIAQDVCTI